MASSKWLSDVEFNNCPAFPAGQSIRALIVGPSACGKTYLAFKWIISGFLDYDRLYIFSTSIKQSIFQALIYGFNKGLSRKELMALFGNIASVSSIPAEKVIDNLVKEKLFMKITTPIKDRVTCIASSNPKDLRLPEDYDKNSKNLFIFDDCMTEQKVVGIIDKFFTLGRHQSFQMIFLSQNYFKTGKSCVRSNANILALFRLTDCDKRNIYTSIASTDFKKIQEFYDLCDSIWAEKYHYLFIAKDEEKKHLKYRNCLDGFTPVNGKHCTDSEEEEEGSK